MTTRHLGVFGLVALLGGGCAGLLDIDEFGPLPQGTGGGGGSDSDPIAMGGATAGGGGDATGGSPAAGTGDLVWAQALGDEQGQHAHALVLHDDGGAWIGGDFAGTLALASGNLDAKDALDGFVVRVDAAGSADLGVAFGGTGQASVAALAPDGAGGLIAAGWFDGTLSPPGAATTLTAAGGRDLFVARLDDAGDVQWIEAIGAAADQRATAVAVSGNTVWVTGQIAGTVDFDGTSVAASSAGDAFVATMALADGALAWVTHLGGPSDGGPRVLNDVAIDGDGAWLVGSYAGSMAIGTDVMATSGSRDAFAVRVDASGAAQDYVLFGAGGAQDAHAVEVDPGSGDVVVVGEFDDALELADDTITTAGAAAFVVRLSATGDTRYAQTIGEADGSARDVRLAADGSVLVCGTVSGALPGFPPTPGDASRDAFVAKLDPQGQPRWAHVFGRESVDVTEACGLRADGSSLAAGTFEGGLTFDPIVMGAGAADVFVLKLAP